MFRKRRNQKRNYDIVFFSRPNSVFAEAYRKIPVNLEYANVDKKIKIIHITSAMPGENKTTIAINLAATYAELNKKVILIDLDLRRPKIHRYFKVPNDHGLSSYLIDQLEYEQLIVGTEHGIDLITSGPKVPSPHVVLRSEKFQKLLEKLSEEYDYIIIDSPPVLLVTDSSILTKYVDATLFVVNEKISRKNEVLSSIRLLKENNANIAGIIVTGKTPKNGHYYYRYDSY